MKVHWTLSRSWGTTRCVVSIQAKWHLERLSNCSVVTTYSCLDMSSFKFRGRTCLLPVKYKWWWEVCQTILAMQSILGVYTFVFFYLTVLHNGQVTFCRWFFVNFTSLISEIRQRRPGKLLWYILHSCNFYKQVLVLENSLLFPGKNWKFTMRLVGFITQSQSPRWVKQEHIHCESKKGRHYTLVHIFAKYRPIFIVLSPTYSVGNLQ